MKVVLKRGEESKEVNNIVITIENLQYRISETIDKRLLINKVSLDGTDDYMKVHPRTGNEVEIS